MEENKKGYGVKIMEDVITNKEWEILIKTKKWKESNNGL